jgi:hypothetical protein
MDIEFAVLCDAASIREGILNVLGAPITRVYRPELPAALGVSLAALFVFEAEDHGQMREFEIKVSNASGVIQKGVGVVAVGPRPDKAETGEDRIFSPFVASFYGQPTSNWGEHTFSVSVDGGEHSKETKLWVLPVEELSLPGGIQLTPEK